jgi:hypothetical protein
MTIQEIIEELKLRANDAEESMRLAEADGNSDYDYHEGRFEAYGAMVGFIESQFVAVEPIK